MGKRAILIVTKIVGGAAGVIFLFCPLRSGTQVLINVISLIVAIGCAVIHLHFDDDDDSHSDGYWPQDPGNSPLYRDPQAGRPAGL
jgi:hypothetical protein